MKLTDDDTQPSMREAIAAKQLRKKAAGKSGPKMYQHRRKVKEGPEEYAKARANLIRLGILNPDGSGKVR